MKRQGKTVAVRHVAEILADMGDEPALGEPAHEPGSAQLSQAAAREALNDPLAAPGARPAEDAFRVGPRHGGAALWRLRERCARPGRDIRDYAVTHLDTLLETFEAQRQRARRQGALGARRAEDARQPILAILRETGAKTVTKGKSMVTEEIALNPFLEANGIVPVETDLGEYIIQLRHEPPSHIIAPAFHLSKEQVAETFREAHTELDPNRSLDERNTLVQEARAVLRRQFEAADAGITGANFLSAAEGAAIIVTNEGNGDLTRLLPKTHIVVTGIEKVVADMNDVVGAAAPAAALGDRPADLDLCQHHGRAGRRDATSRRISTSCSSTMAAPS